MKTKLILAAASIAVLAGCASQRIKTVSEVPVGGTAASTYIVPAVLISGVDSNAIAQKYAIAVRETSGYRSAFNDNGTQKGLLVEQSGNSVSVSYINRTGNLHHDYKAVFNFAVTSQGTDVAVTVTCPATMQDDLSDFDIGLGQWKTFVTQEQATQDLRNICSRAKLKFVKAETGEVNVDFPDASVYANFTRKLQAYNWRQSETDTIKKDDIAKFKWFTVRDGDSNRTLGITVFPYRTGSKVAYRWQNEVVCRANDRCNFDQKSAQRMQEMVTNIAND